LNNVIKLFYVSKIIVFRSLVSIVCMILTSAVNMHLSKRRMKVKNNSKCMLRDAEIKTSFLALIIIRSPSASVG